jgi:succinate dehydrogenase / fumarate reductase membrane anchor subunit
MLMDFHFLNETLTSSFRSAVITLFLFLLNAIATIWDNAMNIGKLSWFLQRYSAFYFLFFLGYVEYLFWTSNLSFNFITTSAWFKALLSIFILLACIHAFIGLWTVGTDYLTKRTLGFISIRLSNIADIIRKIYETLFFILGLVIIFLYFSIIWF